ncbi:hypothetical protein TRFO_18765 [Tritrichomonas foetus]|uniref:Rab-GAP TBC domain-containing protein n=1 Tax=Tritrichomonas foetus TaxID=1144522 RepID=A0A1J4KK84_9EUKA|nr:hypothetical protein TRFO_18765 [Tritrichomonas foetus]|eukprot:OHT11705.1 hypothetical protein TRFO_18765 [Tritrichomonas foetus]
MISTEIPDSRTFDNISMYLTGLSAVSGSISLRKMIMTHALYLIEDGIDSPYPFTDCYTLTPLTKPYVCVDGHHIFDLSFYSEITIIEEPARLCFHDPTQELGISLNFKSKDAFHDFFDYLKSQITIISPGLQGFFQIQRFEPPICDEKKLAIKKKKLFESFHLDSNANSDVLLKYQSELLARITPPNKQVVASEDDLNDAMESQEKMKKFLTKFFIPNERKADVWAFLTGLGPLDTINENRKNEYLALRNQWKSITQSQWRRSKILRDSFNLLNQSIGQNKQKLITVVDDPSIIAVVFNVIMSLCHCYNFLSQKHNEQIHLIRVFLFMFVQRTEKTVIKTETSNSNSNNNQNVKITYYGYRESLSYSSDDLETILFWSMLFILERGEVRRLLELPEKEKGSITAQVNDTIYIVHPLLYELLLKKGVKTFDRLIPLLTMHFSTLLPSCDCTDIWIAATAAPNFFGFIQFMVVSCFFVNFPNIMSLQPQKDQDLMKMIEPIFQVLDHYYLESVAFTLMQKSSELIQEGLADV